jgi:HlyD family secretion protein
MLRKYFLPLLAVALFVFAVYHVVVASQSPGKTEPPVPPARTEFAHTVAASGVVEPQTENISIGSHYPGVVEEVLVKVGQKVKAGEVLFRLDDRQLTAELALREANLQYARSQLKKLDEMPRPEEVPPSEARVEEMRANLVDLEDQFRRARLLPRSVLADEELVRREQAARMARQQWTRAEAELKLLKAGAWQPDKDVAAAAVKQAESQRNQTQVELVRLRVQAPVDGEVLQVNVRPGEFVGAPPNQALVVLGNVTRLHVRVDVDEHDIPRYSTAAAAFATVRGNPGQRYALAFVRVEPYVIPKKSLTGMNTERIDTRVLQVIYALEGGDRPVYVGQQLDVFIDAGEDAGASR